MSDQHDPNHDQRHDHNNHNDHNEHNDHDAHGPAPAYTQRQLSRTENKAREVQAKAIESVLEEDAVITPADLDAVLNAYENDIGPLNGARVVARAWLDPAFKKRLVLNGADAIAELGFGGLQGERLMVVENTPSVHNAVVCALCSCYPWPVLGLPPFWYKSQAYRSRIGGRPREVLSEFGLEISAEREILVWNSSAQTRYMVLPQRPAGTEQMSEDELAGLVTRDAMIGVAEVQLDSKTTQTIAHRRVADMQGEGALPRQSGELIFQEAWEGIAFAIAVAVCEQGRYVWSEFQERLIAQIAEADQQEPAFRPTYYECWLAALEALLVDTNILSRKKLTTRASWLARMAAPSGGGRTPWLVRDFPDEEEET